MVIPARPFRLALLCMRLCLSGFITTSSTQFFSRLPCSPFPQSLARTMVSPYIPPGWTLERLNRAKPADFASLPEEELDRVLAYFEARDGSKSEAERKAEFKTQLRERQNAERERLGLPPRPETPLQEEGQSAAGRPLPTSSQLVEVVERQGYQADWGFLLFRTDYNDESRWKEFEQVFNELIDKSIEDDEVESMKIARIEEGLMIKMVVDEGLEGANMADIRGQVFLVPSLHLPTLTHMHTHSLFRNLPNF
ncbi:MAG: hypothetical protein Q9190_002986 [Brigantiaea leucoxantha]